MTISLPGIPFQIIAEAILSGFYVSENTVDTPKKRGRPVDPNKLLFRNIGLRADEWEYLRGWQSDNDADNFTPAFARLVEFVKVFAPQGSEVGKPRDEKGRFLPSGGTSKMAVHRRQKRERKVSE